jgi:hypothetical protein
MLNGLKHYASMLFVTVCVMGAITGASQGFAAESQANATVELNETEIVMNDSEQEPASPWGNSTLNAPVNMTGAVAQPVDPTETENSRVREMALEFTLQYVKLAEEVADWTAAFVYANQSWVRPWWLQPLIGSFALYPLRRMLRRLSEVTPGGGDNAT